MKIGIVTIYDAYNYGSYLQAYALQKVLKSQGHEVIILNCSKDKFRIIKKLIAKTPAKTFFKLQRYLVYKKAWGDLNIERHKNQVLDAILIGSDEVWNIKNNSFEHWPEYFGYNLNAKKIIAYAPSCGYSLLDDFLNSQFYIDGIKKLDCILVRDENTKLICESLSGSECQKVVDPTLLYFDNWENELVPYKNINDNFLLYYSYNEKPLMLNYIKRFARENDLKIVTAGFKYDWCDENLIVEPKQFLYLMKKAKYVVTTTFHGSVFSVIFKKQFIGFHPNRNPKVHDFLVSVGLDHRTYKANMGFNDFKDILEESIDYTYIHKRLKQRSKQSMILLKNSLS